MHMKYPEQLPELNSRGKHLGLWVILITILLSFWVRHADAAVTFSPAGPESSAYLNSNTVEVTVTQDGWISLQPPSPAGECKVGESTPGYNFGTGLIGTIGASGSLYTYLDGSGAHSTDCSPNGITDYTPDGDWTFRVYSDETFTTVLEDGVFCQGSGCPAPPTPTSTPATSTPISAPYVPFLGAMLFFFAFWTTLFLMLWKRN